MLNNKKILFAAGGTGGHINPALAVAGYIRENYPDAQILFAGTPNKMEAKLVPAAGFDFTTIEVSGFQRDFSVQGIKENISTVVKLIKSLPRAKAIIKDFQPDVVIGFGGYVSGPVVRAAAKMGVPTAVHEQNAFPGVTNKMLAKKVDRVMVTTKAAEEYFDAKNPVTVTGLPVRGEMLRADREISRAELGISDDMPLVLSMGGSLGALAINKAVKELILNRYESKKCAFLHATGSNGVTMIDDLNQKIDMSANPHVMLREYINDMDRCMAAADLVICRAGASTLSELQVMGKASILVPYPYAAENHQFFNAKDLADNNAAIVIEEKDLSGEKLISVVDLLVSNMDKVNEFAANAKKMAVTDASARITKCICDIVK
ncbi:MAG: undecaprenyldiphospho-muramoylpentapeptide beta-N-acetylglucosaminyltransferase [Clostridia bacterium]|nr:undecaprenyldiphospho-muramoylpentapeptide beta-N-acetylglucosaminyltransferase [Clostridia bacterium]